MNNIFLIVDLRIPYSQFLSRVVKTVVQLKHFTNLIFMSECSSTYFHLKYALSYEPMAKYWRIEFSQLVEKLQKFGALKKNGTGFSPGKLSETLNTDTTGTLVCHLPGGIQ